MSVKIYTTTVTTNREIFIRQNRIKQVLEAMGIPFEEVDISKNLELREEIRGKAGIPDLLPPAIFNGDKYCGDYAKFEDAVEDKTLKEFLMIE